MASILPGYEYDIFISYRQKDNRSDQWVTNFVQALREELDATFKEEISIYFDSNPHDGLLETHDVDGSLKEKIKCLVFIPIVSQTYCDPKSFAWEKEFLTFLGFVKQDEFGLDIKLANGNVAKRVLPVRIHEIDKEDKKLFEDSVGGVVRSVDFIYKEPGVNRPLKNSDSRTLNQNKTDYRNQVNKVALAIKDLLSAIRKPQHQQAKSTQEATGNKTKSKSLITFSIISFWIVLAVFTYWLLFSKTKTDNRFDQTLDRAEQYLEEGGRFNDKRYFEQAYQAIQKVLAEDTVNERALYLFISAAPEADTMEHIIRKLERIAPNGIYTLLASAGHLIEKEKNWDQAKVNLNLVLKQQPNNKDALSMMAYLSLITQAYLDCYRYTNQLMKVDAKNAHDILTMLYAELGDFKKAFHHLKLKQDLQEFACNDIEGFQRILLCEGNFEKLEKLTDSLCNFSKCSECAFWQLRAKAHSGKFKEAAQWVGPSLKNPIITWRYPAFVLLKNGKIDSANLIAQAELDFDKERLAEINYKQSIPLYSMAAIYAMLGNSTESLKYLKQYANYRFEMGSEWYISHDPLFDELQKDNEFFADFFQLIQKEQQRKTAIREELRKLEN